MNKHASGYPFDPPDLEPLIAQLLKIRGDMLRFQSSKSVKAIASHNLPSALNLLHYMAFRNHDLRELQLALSEWGLSSLGRAERKVQATVDTVLHTLHRLADKEFQTIEKPPVSYREGRQRLEDNADRLFGPVTQGRRVRIMVTMPSEAAENYNLIKDLFHSGMNCARINCAHDDPVIWKKIVDHIRMAEKELGLTCRIQMDLGGPKLRTGAIEPGPQIVKIRPRRNELGEVLQPSRVWLYAENSPMMAPAEADFVLPVSPDWLSNIQVGDRVLLTDYRKANRRPKVLVSTGQGVLLEFKKTVYLAPGLVLKVERDGSRLPQCEFTIVNGIEPKAGKIRLNEGDRLTLLPDKFHGKPAIFDEHGNGSCASIGITPSEVLGDLRPGQPIWFDDGKIGGVIETVSLSHAQVLITATKPGGDVLLAEKGINLPETRVHLSALSEQDLLDLSFVVKHADMVGLSFANSPADVRALSARMRELSSNVPAVVLKIETKQGFDCLPAMLLAAMESSSCGVMIARGDLAIESGFGRLAEVQEQILWVCEAAHVPVIWATQVLEGLAKSGLPTRSEVTDAAMGQRAECIMLNKGPHILKATKSLGEILLRMQDHQTKKRSLLRKLQLAEKFFSE